MAKSLSDKYFTVENNSRLSFIGQCDGLVSKYSHVANLQEFMDKIEGVGLSLRNDGGDFIISDDHWQQKVGGDLKDFIRKLLQPEPEIIQEPIPEIDKEPELETAPENCGSLEIEEEPIDKEFLELQGRIKNIYDQSGSAAGFVRDLRDSGISLQKIDSDILFSNSSRDFKLSELFSGHLEDNIYNYCNNGLSQGLGR